MRFNSQAGIALVIVVSVLAIVSIMATAFAFTMRLESNAALNYQEGLRANYIAEMGVAHARALLKQDKLTNGYDAYTEPWHSIFIGSDVDNDEDAKADSKWLPFESEGLKGRYAVLVTDENSKLNINTAGRYNEDPLKVTQGASTFEVSLYKFLKSKGIKEADSKASSIIARRYGPDGKPGLAGSDDDNNNARLKRDGVDNNADGLIDVGDEGIDEPDEFSLVKPWGDDKPFVTKEEIKSLPDMTSDIFKKLQNELTVHSKDEDISSNGGIRFDLNHMNAEELYSILKSQGASDPWQYATNIVDACDGDYAMSISSKPYKRLNTIDEGTKGDWYWNTDHYENNTPGGAAGTWSGWQNIPNGEYYVRLYGRAGGDIVGDVFINGISQTHMRHGELFVAGGMNTVIISDNKIAVSIQNNEPEGKICYFKYIELSPRDEKMKDIAWTDIRGVEALRINELMVRPKLNLNVALTDSPGGDWQWQDGYFLNSVPGGGAKGGGEWIFTGLKDGYYYLTLFGAGPGANVGDVEVGGLVQRHVKDGGRWTERDTVSVSGGKLKVRIENNEISGVSTSFKGITLSQEPDAEYIELLNLSPRPVSVAGWKVEGPETNNWAGLIPQDAQPIPPAGYLVLAMDADDTAGGISGNGISFERNWGRLGEETLVAQLEFSRQLVPGEDLLKDASGNISDYYLTLRDERDDIVDRVEYSPSQVTPFKALEKGSPTAIKDSNGNGIDDYWEISEDATGGTAGLINDNKAMYKYVEAEKKRHKIEEVMVRNMQFASVVDILDVADSNEWSKIDEKELAKFADRLTVKNRFLGASGSMENTDAWGEANKPGGLSGIWVESNTKGGEGVWTWGEREGIKNGIYILRLYGEENEEISVSLYLHDGTWTEWTPPLKYGPGGGLTYGKIEIGTGGILSAPDKTLKLKLRNESKSGTAHFEYAVISPIYDDWGRINVNTASLDILTSLPGIDSDLATKLIANRPYGDRESRKRGLGDVMEAVGSDVFRKVANLVTVRSNVFEIISTAQILEGAKVVAERRVRTVVER